MRDWRIGVCGAGAMGRGIAEVAARAGHQTRVFDISPGVLRTAAEKLDVRNRERVSRGRIEPSAAQAITDSIMWTDRMENLAGCQMIIEAVVERRDAKQALYLALEEYIDDGAILATNTSSLPVTALAAPLRCPERFLGVHFFNPALVMELVEVVPSMLAANKHVQTVMQLMSDWGKHPVLVKDVPGFLVNRLAAPFFGEAWHSLEEEAASAPMIDHLIRSVGGFRMGPMELGDLVGHDQIDSVGRSIFASYHGHTRFRPSLTQGQLVAAGKLGRKSGHELSSREIVIEPLVAAESSLRLTVPKAGGQMRTQCEATGAKCEVSDDLPANLVLAGDVGVAWSRGASARHVSQEMKRPVAVIDHAGVPGGGDTPVMPFSVSADAAEEVAVWFIRRVGGIPIRIGDRPGGIVFRTFLQMANAAGDALLDCVADCEAIDSALALGMNFPIGPLSWARAYGISETIGALEAIAAETGDVLYTPSEGLRRLQ